MKKISKIFIILVTAIFISRTLYLPPVQAAIGPSGLTVPVFDTATAYVHVPTEVSKWALDKALEIALQALKKQILNMMVNQIVDWINGGGGGKPKFVSNWDWLLKDAANAAADDFVKELRLGFLCQPFNLPVQAALRPAKTFRQRADCTLDDIVRNINNFYADFRNGGWAAYASSWEPQNNYFGSLLMATAELERRQSAASGAQWSEAMAGGGFLSTKKCLKGIDGKDIPGTCEITTPGKTIGDTVARAVGADIDFIVNADDLSDYIGLIADALVNRIISAGTDGLKGAKKSGRAPTGATGADPCAGLSGSILETCRKYRQAYGASFVFSQDGLMKQIDYTLQPRLQAKDLINGSIKILEDYIKSLTDIYGELSKLSVAVCQESGFYASESVNRADVMANIQKAISDEQAIISRLRQDLINNQSVIDVLQTAKDQIGRLAENQWTEMIAIFNGVSGRLDALAAENFRSAAESEQDQIYKRTGDNLTNFNRQLSLCQNTY